MSEIFRIIGKNDIHFDAPPPGNYRFTHGKPPRKLSTILTRKEVSSLLPRLPLGVRPLALKHGLSVITMELNIQGTSDADMEAKEHALIETLVETDVFFSNGGTMGTKGELQVKSDGASEVSFKSIFYGVLDELDARDVLGAVIKAHRLEGLRLTLYCEENWRPGTFNHLFNGGFEFWDRVQYGGDGSNTEPDGWEDMESGCDTPDCENNRESTPANVQQGDHALRIEVDGIDDTDYKGVQQDLLARLTPGIEYTFIVWLKNAAITRGYIHIAVGGDVSGWDNLYHSGAANTEYTRYMVTHTPHPNDTYLRIDAYIYAIDDICTGTAYIDGMMIVRGRVIPDDFIEWHPNPGIRIGPNILSNADFEEWPADITDNQPDCWDDYEWNEGSMTGEVNNQESIEVLQGCHALEVVIPSSAGPASKGVEQDIRARLTNDVEYVLVGWVKNEAITNGFARLRAEGGNFGNIWALNNGAANDEYTRYAVTFTPTAADAFVVIICSINTNGATPAGTAYFDKLMVIEAQVYNGHSFAPEEWTGCGRVWNHLDGPCGSDPPETQLLDACGHVNYLDLADLRGDVDSRLRIEMESLYYKEGGYGPGELTVARRTEHPGLLPIDSELYRHSCLPCEFVHFLEAEDATTQEHWGNDHIDNDRSNCKVLRNSGADLAGYVIWDYTTLGYDLACQKGRFRVLGALYAEYVGDVVDDDIKFRLTHGPAAYQQGRWLQPLIDKTWHWLDLGVFHVTGQSWGDELPATLYWRLDYQKAANDIVELDFLLLVPEDESMLRIPLGEYFLATNEDTLWDDTFDFTLAMKRNDADAFVWHPPVQAEPLALKPEEQNRLIFAMGHWISDAFPYKGCYVHEDNGEHMIVSLKYLPQFVSPLE